MICCWLHSQTANLATIYVSLQDMVLDLLESNLAETMCYVHHCHSDDKYLTDLDIIGLQTSLFVNQRCIFARTCAESSKSESSHIY